MYKKIIVIIFHQLIDLLCILPNHRFVSVKRKIRTYDIPINYINKSSG